MTEQEYIEKMARDIKESLHCSCRMLDVGSCNSCEFLKYRKPGTDCQAVCIASALYHEDYRKLSEDDIVLSMEDLKLYAKDCVCGELTELDIINGLIEKAKRKESEARMKTAEEILKKVFKKDNLVRDEGYDESGSWITLTYEIDVEEARELAREYGVGIEK